ncbi:MAG: type II secretion system F family protein [Thermoplasmata archaeon]|nr:type II secretion system F family protein [Thermoplasmata archaeon]
MERIAPKRLRDIIIVKLYNYAGLIITSLSALLVIVFMFLAFLRFVNVISAGSPADFVTVAILGGTGLYGGYNLFRERRIRKIDDRFPDFIRDLAESKRAGMTFTKAIFMASKGNYGALTPEIRLMARQISWGESVTDALSALARRVNTPLVKRAVTLIIEASKGGGATADILMAAAKDAREMKFLQSERKASMFSYVMIVYIGAITFLAIVIILCSTFLPNLTKGAVALSSGGIGAGAGISIRDLESIFFWGAVIQSIGSGLVAGVFESGSLVDGTKHVCVLVFITWMTFKLLVGI